MRAARGGGCGRRPPLVATMGPAGPLCLPTFEEMADEGLVEGVGSVWEERSECRSEDAGEEREGSAGQVVLEGF